MPPDIAGIPPGWFAKFLNLLPCSIFRLFYQLLLHVTTAAPGALSENLCVPCGSVRILAPWPPVHLQS